MRCQGQPALFVVFAPFQIVVLSFVLVASEFVCALELESPTPFEGLSLLQLRVGRVGGYANALSSDAVAHDLDAALTSVIADGGRGTSTIGTDATDYDSLAELLGRMAGRADSELAAEVDGALARAAARLAHQAVAAREAALAVDGLRFSIHRPDKTSAKDDDDEDERLAAFNVTEVERQLEAVRKLRRDAEEDEFAQDDASASNNSLVGENLSLAAEAKGLVENHVGEEAMAQFRVRASEITGQLRRVAVVTKKASQALESMASNSTTAGGVVEMQRLGLGLDELSGLLESQQAASELASHGVRGLRCSFAMLLVPETLEQQADCNNGFGNRSEALLRSVSAADEADLTDAVPKPKQEKKGVLRFVHIISLMPGMDAEQSAVLESMAGAKKHAESRAGSMDIEVTLLAVQMVGEKKQKLPSAFHLAPPLSNNTNAAFGCQRSLPFARDLMLTLEAHAPDADFFVMTNSDICVTPHFYIDLANANRQDGFTGLNVLKVMIPAHCDGKPLSENRSKALHFAETLPQTHPGSDCFMWEAQKTRDVINLIGDVFFGWPPLGSALHNAIRSVSSKFRIVRGEHWTYHIGGEGERGRGSTLHIPSVVTKYQAEVEKAYPGCKFMREEKREGESKQAEGGGVGDGKDVEDCNYVSLNTQWSDLYKRCIESDVGCMDADQREVS